MDDLYLFVLLGTGLAMVAAAWLPTLLERSPISFAMLCVVFGYGLGFLPAGRDLIDTIGQGVVMEHLSELAVLLSLAGAGLSLDLEATWKAWKTPMRLLLFGLPLTIGAIFFLGHHVLGLSAAGALLLGAVCAPTDPVLASEVQVKKPGEEHEFRSVLTAEACLNDALAFPFTAAAIYLAAAQGEVQMSWLMTWFSYDVVYRIGMGALVGLVCGRALARVTFDYLRDHQLNHKTTAMIVLGLTGATYALCEIVHGYGFLAVFCAAAYFRRYRKHHSHHDKSHDLATQMEHVFMVFFLLSFGILLHSTWLEALNWKLALAGVFIVLVVRPVSGWLSLWGTHHGKRAKFALSFLGIRGIGSIYYLSYASTHGEVAQFEVLWSTVSVVILCSIFVHGSTAKKLIDRCHEKPIKTKT